MDNRATNLLSLLVRLYRLTLGTVLPNSCRFHPTCSEYALHALAEHGPIQGTWLTVRRLLRCHPFSLGGYDPVPTRMPKAPQADALQPEADSEWRRADNT